MLVLPLLVTTLTLAPTDATSRFEVSVGGSFDYDAVKSPFLSANTLNGFDGGAGAALNLFVHRVHDDDAPPTLQPYLQRVGELRIDGGGGGFTLSRDAVVGDRTGHNGWFDLSAWGYAAKYFYGSVGFGVHYASVTDFAQVGPSVPVSSTALTLPFEVAGGLRVADARLSVGWTITPTNYNDSSFSVPFWGHAFVHGFDVIRRRVALDARVDLLEGGAGAAGGGTVYLTRRFGVGAVVRGSHEHTSNAPIVDHAGAGLRFDAWATPRVAVAVGCYFDWWQYSTDSAGAYQNDYVSLIDLTFRARPR